MIGVVKCILLATVAVAASGQSLRPQDVTFHLFTSDPQQSEALWPNSDSIMMSSFNPDAPLVVVIPGHEAFINFFSHMTHVHMGAQEVNVLAVDWSRVSGMYSQGLSVAPEVGEVVAQFVTVLLDDFFYEISKIKFVGLGLGAHVAGIAARKVNGHVPHIVALDPSLHGWTHHPDRLGRDAATVVEVIHTTAGRMGYDDPLGHIDFYPNGGSHQPGCAMHDVVCSHDRAFLFYSESIVANDGAASQFIGTRCDDFEQAANMKCSGSRDVVFGGLQDKSGVTGILTFITNNGSPFARN